VDSADGLAIDRTFSEELQRFRSEADSQLCELTKLAFDPSPNSRPLLAALFHVIYIYGMQHYDCTDLFIEVNPRHVRFYEVMLGFSRLGPQKENGTVKAPSQLMHIKVSDIGRCIELYAGSEPGRDRSLYPYFLPKAEERSLWSHIAHCTGRAPTSLVA
jgi:hypothetical protein